MKLFNEESLEMIWKMIVSLMSGKKSQFNELDLELLAEELGSDYFRTFLLFEERVPSIQSNKHQGNAADKK